MAMMTATIAMIRMMMVMMMLSLQTFLFLFLCLFCFFRGATRGVFPLLGKGGGGGTRLTLIFAWNKSSEIR